MIGVMLGDGTCILKDTCTIHHDNQGTYPITNVPKSDDKCSTHPGSFALWYGIQRTSEQAGGLVQFQSTERILWGSHQPFVSCAAASD